MAYSRLSQTDGSNNNNNHRSSSSGTGEQTLTDDEPRDNDRLMNSFESDSDSESDSGADWIDDRQTPDRSNPTPTPASSVEDASRAEPVRPPWSNIFAPFRKSKPESGHVNGVFGNLEAKAEEVRIDNGEDTIAEEPPSYEEAAADATPSYWETTIMASDWSDEVLVGDLPVGSPMHFAWNMLISATFSFVGFFISYLFHTTHAARGGSLAGFGCTLIQTSYSFDTMVPSPQAPPDEFTPDDPTRYDGGIMSGVIHHPDGSSMMDQGGGCASNGEAGGPDAYRSSWISNIMFAVGCFLIIRGFGDYLYAQVIKNRILQYNATGSEHTEEQPAEQAVVEGQV